MKNKITFIILCAILAFSLPACSSPSNDRTAEEDGQNKQQDETPEPIGKATVNIDYASDSLLENNGSYHEYIADESEFQVKTVISTDRPIQNLRVLALNMEDINADGIMTFSVTREMFSLDKLDSEKPLVIGMSFAGVVPNMGISYTDTDGVTELYSISMSGENGDLLLLKSEFAE